MPMYNKGCDYWRLLSYLCSANTNSKVISRADPIAYYSLLAGLYVRSCISSTEPNIQIPAFPLISKTKTP